LGELCWWQEYATFLATAGLLTSIRKVKCFDAMSFGDCLPPLFITLQVPLLYSCEDGTSILVFTNVRIVSNAVGLLDGKSNMMAMGLSCSLGIDRPTKFRCKSKMLLHKDEGSHFFLQLDKPRPFFRD
jgi:hypothetical protein